MRRSLAIIAAVAAMLLVGASASGASPRTDSGFVSVHLPSPGAASYLRDVAAVSGDDVWAVGWTVTAGDQQRLLTEQYRGPGIGWSVVHAPNPGGPNRSDFFIAVSADSGGSVWAVGSNDDTGRGIAEEWNGTEWINVPVPASVGGLDEVVVLSSTDVWALGGEPIHWDGSHWHIVPNDPQVEANGGEPTSMTSDGAGGLDIAGVWSDPSNPHLGTYIEHWNGSSWHVMSELGPSGAIVWDISASSPSNIWAVGQKTNRRTSLISPLAEKWNGTAWHRHNLPAHTTNHVLYSVVALSAPNVWAVGYGENTSGAQRTLIDQWTGSSWAELTSPNVGTSDVLNAITAVPGDPNDLWAVGTADNHPLALHHAPS